MADKQNSQDVADQPEVMNWSDFLQDHPPGSFVHVSAAAKKIDNRYNRIQYELLAPELQLHCPEPSCNGRMFFETEDGGYSLGANTLEKTFLTYQCRNCSKFSKIFALGIRIQNDGTCEVCKFGEWPPFGPPVPSRVLRLIQPDRELFLSGRQCENQGLGIGAFTYYRRVVENQWTRLVGEIIKAAKAIGASQEAIEALESEKDEQQFSKGVKDMKEAMPPALLINGHNPLLLLHGVLSQGVHNLPDEECLNLATSIRVVLAELAEKVGQALKNEKELSDAVSRLLQAQASKTKRTSG